MGPVDAGQSGPRPRTRHHAPPTHGRPGATTTARERTSPAAYHWRVVDAVGEDAIIVET
jgi:hypothetical protein